MPQEMDDQTQQLFVQTMVLAPEVYKEFGGDQIPDEFVNAMKQVQQNPNLVQAVAQEFPEVIQLCQQLFMSNQDQIVAATQKLQQATASRKKGGKMDFFKRCYGHGGSLADCGCTDIKTEAKNRYASLAAKISNIKYK